LPLLPACSELPILSIQVPQLCTLPPNTNPKSHFTPISLLKPKKNEKELTLSTIGCPDFFIPINRLHSSHFCLYRHRVGKTIIKVVLWTNNDSHYNHSASTLCSVLCFVAAINFFPIFPIF